MTNEKNRQAVLGLEIDYRAKTARRLADAEHLNSGKDFDCFPMFGGRKRCHVNHRGEIVSFCDENNLSPEDASLEVMVYQPCFYYRVEPLDMEPQTDGMGFHLRRAAYFVSAQKGEGFKRHPAFYDEEGNEIDYILLSAYEAALYDSSLNVFFNDNVHSDPELDLSSDSVHSLPGYKPVSGHRKALTRENFEALAHNLGKGWHGEGIKSLCAQQLLMMIEYGTMNMQKALGAGVTAAASSGKGNNSAFTGATAPCQNQSMAAPNTMIDIEGQATLWQKEGFSSVSYRGVENPYGSIWTYVHGINIWGDGHLKGGVPYIARDCHYQEHIRDKNYECAGFTLSDTCGFWSAAGWGLEDFDWLLMASECAGDNQAPVGDYQYVTPSLDGYRLIRMGGNWHYEDKTGMFTLQAHLKSTFTCKTFRSRGVGGRLVYIPSSRQESDIHNIAAWKKAVEKNAD